MWINLTDAEKALIKVKLQDGEHFPKEEAELLARIKELETPGEDDDAYISAMEERYGSHPWTDGDIDFDDDPIISHGDGGAYVMAWFWVRDEDAGVEEDEGVSCDDCNGTWTEDRIKDGVCDECRPREGRILMADADLRHWKGQAVRQMARYLKLHNDAYPDVGWGKSWDSCVEDALKELGVKREDVDPAILANPERPSRKP